MRITFIRPSMIGGKAHDAMEPLVFAILAGLTPPDIDRRMYDDRIEDIPFDEPTDLACLTVDTFSARRAYQIATRYHLAGVPVIMGGPHPTLCTQEALSYADAVITGDAEDVWHEVIRDAQEGHLRRLYKSNFSSIRKTYFDRSVFAGKKYRFIRITQFSRGCPHACEFCSVHAFYGNSIRHRALENVAADMAGAGKGVFFFTDDNLFADRDAGKSLCAALKPLRKKWACQISLESAADTELVKSMAESGCIMAILGFESLDSLNLRQMNKQWNTASGGYQELIHVLSSQGIMVYGSFVFGYDADTPDTIKRCADFAIQSKLALANFNPLMPFPGTALYARLQRERRLLHDTWWLDPAYRFGKALFTPRGMSAEQLEQGCFQAKKDFNKMRSLLGRACDGRSNSRNLGLFLALNLASRHEILRKQGLRLGDAATIKPLFAHEADTD